MREREGWRWFSYAPEDAKAAQAELNRLAAEGLELEEIWFCAAKFKHVEGRAPACWVEPARWTSMRLKDEEKQREYLELCEEAGWTLVDQSRSMFWFKASPGKAPAPIQTDGGVEWEAVLRGALRERAWQLMGLTVFWALHFILRLLLGNVHFWELFLSDSAMILMACLSIWLVLDILRGAHVLRYRSQCRRSVREGKRDTGAKSGGSPPEGVCGICRARPAGMHPSCAAGHRRGRGAGAGLLSGDPRLAHRVRLRRLYRVPPIWRGGLALSG